MNSSRRGEIAPPGRHVLGVTCQRCRVFLGLNIFSMRSVIMKPPTTLIVAAVHRDEAEHRAHHRRGRRPAATSEPTSEMPEIALVADISGVCSSGGTRVITW